MGYTGEGGEGQDPRVDECLAKLEMLKAGYELVAQKIAETTPAGYIKYDEHGNPIIITDPAEREAAIEAEYERLMEPLDGWNTPT